MDLRETGPVPAPRTAAHLARPSHANHVLQPSAALHCPAGCARVQNKKRLRVVEWSLNQTSLDEVFMNIAQAPEAEYHISGPVSGSSFASGSAPVDVVV